MRKNILVLAACAFALLFAVGCNNPQNQCVDGTPGCGEGSITGSGGHIGSGGNPGTGGSGNIGGSGGNIGSGGSAGCSFSGPNYNGTVWSVTLRYTTGGSDGADLGTTDEPMVQDCGNITVKLWQNAIAVELTGTVNSDGTFVLSNQAGTRKLIGSAMTTDGAVTGSYKDDSLSGSFTATIQ